MTQGVPSVMDLIEQLRVMQSDKNPRVEFGKGIAAVTSATWVQLTVGGTIYNAWVPGKENVTLSEDWKRLLLACTLT
ncbi:hypothetical protein YC2023_014526 [Brassica napus]